MESIQSVFAELADRVGDCDLWEDDPNAAEGIRAWYWPVKSLVEELRGRYPPLNQLPGDGQRLWRDLQTAADCFTAANQRSFFWSLDRFDQWLSEIYDRSAIPSLEVALPQPISP